MVAAEDLRVPDLAPPVSNPDARALSRRVLADGVVRFVGEPVAVVVATDPYTAEDAAQLIDLELSDALGVELNELPLTPERVIAAARPNSDIYVAVP